MRELIRFNIKTILMFIILESKQLLGHYLLFTWMHIKNQSVKNLLYKSRVNINLIKSLTLTWIPRCSCVLSVQQANGSTHPVLIFSRERINASFTFPYPSALLLLLIVDWRPSLVSMGDKFQEPCGCQNPRMLKSLL